MRSALMMAAAAISLSASLSGCNDCNRDGCEALELQAPESGTGIGGVVASESDSVNEGCQECAFQAGGGVAIWHVEAAVSSPAAANAVFAAAEPLRVNAPGGSFYAALAPGQYLVCAAPNCINVAVTADATSTVNVKRRNGPTSFFVVDAQSQRLEEDYGLDVGYEVDSL
jgi:hypothetical protein